MYLSHWGLTDSPFSKDRDAHLFYQGLPQEEALARLHFLVDRGRRLGLLCGPLGCGKSLLLDVFAGQLRRGGRKVVVTSALGRTSRELLWEVASRFGVMPSHDAEMMTLWRAIADHVAENRWQQVDTVLLIDDVEEIGADMVTTLVRLVEIDPTPNARWTVLLVTDTVGFQRLGERLLDQIALRIDLTPWQPQDTIDYVQHALAAAGGRPAIVADDALTTLHDLSAGVPRHVNRLIDLALVAGAGVQLDQLDATTIQSAAEELVVR